MICFWREEPFLSEGRDDAQEAGLHDLRIARGECEQDQDQHQEDGDGDGVDLAHGELGKIRNPKLRENVRK